MAGALRPATGKSDQPSEKCVTLAPFCAIGAVLAMDERRKGSLQAWFFVVTALTGSRPHFFCRP